MAEPPVRTNGATPFFVAMSYFAIAGSNPYTSRIERALDGSMLSISILYESYEMQSIMASARVLSSPQIFGTIHFRGTASKRSWMISCVFCVSVQKVSGFGFRQFEGKYPNGSFWTWLTLLR